MSIENISHNLIKFSFTVSGNSYKSDHSYLLNYRYSSIPQNKLVWDAFGTSNWFANLPLDKKVVAYGNNIITIFNSYYSDPTFCGGFNLANRDSDATNTGWVDRYQDGEIDGWIFDFSLLFDSAKDYSSVFVCKNFTGSLSSGVRVKSPSYSFANTVSLDVCSSEKVFIDKSEPATCAFSSNQHKCPFYEARYDVLRSDTITPYGSDTSINLELRISLSLSGTALYSIMNTTLNETSTTISSFSRNEETDDNAMQVYLEILSAYEDGFTNLKQLDLSTSSPVEKNSFILSLV